MTLREFIISRVHLYFILVALIFAVSMGVGLIFPVVLILMLVIMSKNEKKR